MEHQLDNIISSETDNHAPATQLMSIDEAREVLWLRNNHQPLGELIDEGFLSKFDLEWAVAKAYNASLRQAALVLLNADGASQPKAIAVPERLMPTVQGSSSALPISMMLDQARETEWPMRPHRGQLMGDLLDQRLLSLKDLGFAVENAYEARVREAARALLLVRLNQLVQEPESSAGLLHVVSGGRTFSEKRQYAWALIEGTLIDALLGALIVVVMVQLIGEMPSNKPLPNLLGSTVGFIALIILVLLCIGTLWFTNYLFNMISQQTFKRVEQYRKGHAGEERVVAAMHYSLDGNWFLFRNVVLPGRSKADINSVLVGPSGVWAFEIKTFTGDYRNKGDQWEFRVANTWKTASQNPSRQAQNSAVRLADFLKADAIQQWVNAAVIWANPESKLTVENPSVAVWQLDRLPDELGNIWQDETLSEATRQKLVSAHSDVLPYDQLSFTNHFA